MDTSHPCISTFPVEEGLSLTPHLTTLGPRWENRVDGRTTLGHMLASLRTDPVAGVIQVSQHLLPNPFFSK